ncbi:MAG: ABC transporter permease [Clostridiales bacterium]|nr:ABC transporter permease [Clostridiales bacterium]
MWQAPFKGFESVWKSIGDFLYNNVFSFINNRSWKILWPAFGETLYMTVVSTLIAYILGLALGIVLVTTRKNGVKPMPTFNAILGAIVNFLRSIPFLILLAMLLPVTKGVVGKMMGTVAIVFPLIISAFPYVARMVEGSFNEVDPGIIEASKAMGSTTMQIIRKVLLPEALPSLINGFSICMTTILAYTAMASAAAGGGLGSVAITYGLNQQRYDIMYAASIMLVVLVQIITVTGTVLTRKKDHRLR